MLLVSYSRHYITHYPTIPSSGHNPACASYYGNRSAAYMMLEDYRKALADAQQSISLDEGFVKGYLRAAKCQTMLGDPDLSLVWYDKALQLQPRNKQAIEEVTHSAGVHYEYH